MKTLNLRITIRIEPKQRKQIEKEIAQGKRKSVSDLVRTAIAEFLEQTNEREKCLLRNHVRRGLSF